MNNAGMAFGVALILFSAFLDYISNDLNNSQTDYATIKEFVSLCYITSCLVSIMYMIQ